MRPRRKRPLRVLMISPQFRPLYGGYEHAAERLSGALSRRGVEIVVISERRHSAWPARETFQGFKIRRLWCIYRRHLHTATSLLSFATFLLTRGRRFDVWHVHQYGFHGGLAAAMGRILRRPVVLKLTNSAAMGIEQVLSEGFLGPTLARFHRGVSACIAISEETRAEAVAFGIPSERIHLIPNGLAPDQFLPASNEERKAARETLRIESELLVLSIGRLSEEKNPIGLLQAWALMGSEPRRRAVLAMVGDGPQEHLVRQMAGQLRLNGAVRLPGRSNDVAPWYRAADIYVIASHNEGLSNSMIEALAAGLPVISTRVSGSSFLTDDPPAGVIVGTASPEELAEAIAELILNGSGRQELATNARTVFEKCFLLDSVAEKTLTVYRALTATTT